MITLNILLLVAVLIAVIAFPRWIDRRTMALYSNTKRDGAIAHSMCMIRDGAMQCPGIALVVDNYLTIQTVFGKKRSIPLSSITVIREARGSGRYAWWGKQVFYLNTPETTNLAIGVKDAEPWRKALTSRVDGPTTKP
jgi:hypothetical protein